MHASRPSGAPEPARPIVHERSTYEPSSAQEAFIVPLLREAIEGALDDLTLSGRRLLDAGCGEQPFRRKLESRGWTYSSLDVQQNQQQNVDIIQALDAPLAPEVACGRFDVILCLEVLEHVFDWHVAVQNLADLLSPGGVVVCTVPFVYELHEEPYDFWRPTPHALMRAFEGAGLQITSQERLGDGWDVLGTLVSTMHVRRLSAARRHRVMARAARLLQRSLMKSLLAHHPGRAVQLESPYFLSNVLVASKPTGSAGT